MSHTTPLTHMDLTSPYRCYVVFYYKGNRHRLYNAKPLGKNCFPNHQKKMGDRKKELARLCQLVTEALKEGWYPDKELEKTKDVYLPTAVEQIREIQGRFDKNGWAKTYKRDMDRITNEFVEYLILNHPLITLSALTPVDLSRFLDIYRSSGRYYMNKRRNLSALYHLLLIEPNPVAATPTMKVSEHLNEAYKPDELMKVLQFLQKNHPNLYLCALMTYGTLLRPHREIRLLRRQDFDQNLEFIVLSGKAVKNGKIRKVTVPDYIRTVLLERNTAELKLVENIFSMIEEPLNEDYFTTAWTRMKNLMMKQGLIRKDQTLYSFLHSAAIYSYENQ